MKNILKWRGNESKTLKPFTIQVIVPITGTPCGLRIAHPTALEYVRVQYGHNNPAAAKKAAEQWARAYKAGKEWARVFMYAGGKWHTI